MKNIFVLLGLTTLLFPLINYIIEKYEVHNSINNMIFLMIIIFYGGYIFIRYKPKLIFEFDSLFFKYLGILMLFKIILTLMFNSDFNPDLPHMSLLYILVFLLLPFFEELFFRYYVFYKLKSYSTTKKIIISGFLFAIAHIWAPEIGLLYIFLFGVLFASYYVKSQNLLMVYLLHLINNVIALFFMTKPEPINYNFNIEIISYLFNFRDFIHCLV